jgi:bacillithiol biosynthesis deacetylase BshB1
MILVAFGAHPDDVELALGATLANAALAGHRVLIVDLTRGERGSGGSGATRMREASAAAKILGTSRVTLGLPDTELSRFDRRQLRALVKILRLAKPDLAFAPTGRDRHPDHVETHHLVRRAAMLAGFRRVAPALGAPHRLPALLYYPSSRESLGEPDLIVDVGMAIERKMAALAAYRSQFVRRRGGPGTPINAPGFLARVRARAAALGAVAGCDYAEGFQIAYPLVVRDPVALWANAKPGGWRS